MNEEKYPSRFNEFFLFLNITLLLCSVALLVKISIKATNISAREAQQELADTVDQDFYDFARTFSETYNIIREKHVDAAKVEPKNLFLGALEGMFLKLDPHSQYMGSDNFTQLTKETEGQYSGIGIHISMRDGVLTVISPIPGTPAARQGVLPWDRIVEIEGKTTKGITLTGAVNLLTGPPDTEVSFKVAREGEAEFIPITVRRTVIKIENVYSQILDGDIGYIRLAKFAADTHKDMKKTLMEFKKAECNGVIIDLRYNAGGLLIEAVENSDLFLDPGQLIVSTKGRTPDSNREFKAASKQILETPLIVLVNEASASASEIFAGAIQDHQRGVIMGPKGKKTYGKGSVQTVEQLIYPFERDEDGNLLPAAVRITTALYYTPSGRSIHRKDTLDTEGGITPDAEVELPNPTHPIDVLVYGLLLGDVNLEEGSDDKEPPEEAQSDKQVTEQTEQAGAAGQEVQDAKVEDVQDVSLTEDEKGKFYIKIINKKIGEELTIRFKLKDIELIEALKKMRQMIEDEAADKTADKAA